MAGMTSTGLTTLRYSEIVANIKDALYSSLSSNIDLSEDSAIGLIINTVAREISNVHEIISEVYDAGLVLKAEGSSLDEICLNNGIYRYVAKATSGMLEVTGDIGSELSSDARVRSTAGDIYNPEASYTLTPTSCLAATMIVNSINVGETYSIIIDNVVYSYVVQDGDTALTILTALMNDVNGGILAIASIDSTTDPDVPTLTVQRDPGDTNERTQVMVVTATTYLTFTKITALTYIECTETGAIVGAAGTVNSLETTITGIDSVYNRYDLTLGSDEETDTALRQRYLDSLVVTGLATYDAVLQAVKRVSGVQTAILTENETEATVDSVPPKSFKVTVVGGAVDDIAQAIWDTKPLGIRPYGTTQGTATDKNSNEHIMWFMRPDPKFVWINLSWQIDDEESLNYTEAEIPGIIKEAINTYGATLSVGDDIIPNRIIRYVYAAVDGIIINSVTAATTDSQVTAPDSGDFQSTRISITEGQYTVWESNQYTLTEESV